MDPNPSAPSWLQHHLLMEELLFDASPDAILVVRNDGLIVFANATVEKLFGFTKSELQGMKLDVLIPERYRVIHRNHCANYNSQPATRPMGVGLELLACRKDGSEFPVDVALSSLRPKSTAEAEQADSSQYRYTFAAVRDVTLQRQVERQHAEMSELLTRQQQESVDTICHELRSPLLGMFGAITFLKETFAMLSINTPLTEDQLSAMREHVSTLEQCAQHQRDLVEETLDLSRAKASSDSSFSLTLELVSITSLLVSIRRLFELQLRSKKLKLCFNVVPPSLVVYVDRKRLFQVITNLLSNAIKFTHQGVVNVNAFLEAAKTPQEQSQLRISIEDTGIGMSAEEVSRLFHRYVQASSEIAAQYGGSGLGLVISKRLVELMGGTISIDSEKGVGTKVSFSVVLRKPPPKSTTDGSAIAHDGAPVIEKPPASVSTSHRSLNVLIAEDNLVNQRIVSKFVERAGHSPFVANNGAEAVKMCSAMAFDLILMDIEMPIMGGYEATRKIRELERSAASSPTSLRRIPIIGVSGNARQQRIDEAMDAGMDDYITKPFLEVQLREVMARFTTSQSAVV